MKQCTRCGIITDEYYPDKRCRDGFTSACKSCCRKAKNAWRAQNLERARIYDRERYKNNLGTRKATNRKSYIRHAAKRRQYIKKWRKDNPDKRLATEKKRRARKYGTHCSTLTTSQWKAIKKYWRDRCAYCGTKPKRLTQDHVTPLSKRGTHTASNVVPSCQLCNSKKGTGEPLRPVQTMLDIDI